MALDYEDALRHLNQQNQRQHEVINIIYIFEIVMINEANTIFTFFHQQL